MLGRYVKKAIRYIRRNDRLMDGSKVAPGRVNLDYWHGSPNVGDILGPVIYEWMLQKKGISPAGAAPKTRVLLTVGSILGMGPYDAVVWGSGVLRLGLVHEIYRRRRFVKLDVRAVRGPITKDVLKEAGYNVENAALGDPGILMPCLYTPQAEEKKYKVSVITHWKNDAVDREILDAGVHTIDVATEDYRHFINELCRSERVISSSLHGIILAEAYGIPAVFLNRNHSMEAQLVKFYDWYYSTGRYSVKIACSLEEALTMAPMQLPELAQLQQGLMAAFPYDLWR